MMPREVASLFPCRSHADDGVGDGDERDMANGTTLDFFPRNFDVVDDGLPEHIGCPIKRCPRDQDHSEMRGFLHQDATDKKNSKQAFQVNLCLFTYQNKTSKQKHKTLIKI